MHFGGLDEGNSSGDDYSNDENEALEQGMGSMKISSK